MLDRLNVRYGKFNGNGIRYTRAEHVKSAAGWNSRRVCDYMAMDLWTGLGEGSGAKLHGHEVKVSRADWLTELRDPDKAETFSRFCDYWWLVIADKSMIRPDELPAHWGLMVPHGRSLRVFAPAPLLRAEPMPRSLQATLTRAVTKTSLRLARSTDPAAIALGDRMGLPRFTTEAGT